VARIRRLEIQNFRSIRALDWAPSAGINCLVGPGDGGKSSILDAIELCLGARRSVPFGDTESCSVTPNKWAMSPVRCWRKRVWSREPGHAARTTGATPWPTMRRTARSGTTWICAKHGVDLAAFRKLNARFRN
jgi:hypothetical protein